MCEPVAQSFPNRQGLIPEELVEGHAGFVQNETADRRPVSAQVARSIGTPAGTPSIPRSRFMSKGIAPIWAAVGAEYP